MIEDRQRGSNVREWLTGRPLGLSAEPIDAVHADAEASLLRRAGQLQRRPLEFLLRQRRLPRVVVVVVGQRAFAQHRRPLQYGYPSVDGRMAKVKRSLPWGRPSCGCSWAHAASATSSASTSARAALTSLKKPALGSHFTVMRRMTPVASQTIRNPTCCFSAVCGMSVYHSLIFRSP